MKQRRSLDQVGLRLSRQALRVLKDRGIFVQSAVSLEHQHPGQPQRGAWNGKYKELMGLVASACLRCDDCIKRPPQTLAARSNAPIETAPAREQQGPAVH